MTTRGPIVPGDARGVARAVGVLRGGEPVALPTETVYGLAADAFDPRAVARVFAIKGRPRFDPLIVHLPDVGALERVARLPDAPALRERIKRLTAPRERGGLWPGPLTLLLPRHPDLPPIVTAGLDTVAVRVPDHPVFLAVLRAFGGPLAAPSANPFGYVSPTTARHVADQLGASVSLIVDGGPCAVGIESTIVDPLSPVPRVLRSGGLSPEQLTALLGPTVPGEPVLDRPEAPGQLARHYAPGVPVRLLPPGAVPPASVDGAWLLVLQGPAPAEVRGYARVECPAPDGDLTRTAARLYAVLREADEADAPRLDVLACAPDGLGAALLDRVRRAGAGSDAPAG